MDTLRALAARREHLRTAQLVAESVLFWSLPLAIPLIMLWFVVTGEPTSARITAKQFFSLALGGWLLLIGGAIHVAVLSSLLTRRITRRLEQESEALANTPPQRLIAGEYLGACVVCTPDDHTLRLQIPALRRVALGALAVIGVLGYASSVLLLLSGLPGVVWLLFFTDDQGVKKGMPAFCALVSLGICSALVGRHAWSRLSGEPRRPVRWRTIDAPLGNGLLVKDATVRRKMGDEIETLIVFDAERDGRDHGALCARRLTHELESRFGPGDPAPSSPTDRGDDPASHS